MIFFYISTERQHQRSTTHFVSHTLSKVRMAKRLDRRRSCCAIGKEAASNWKAVPWFKRRVLWQDLSNNQKNQLFSNRPLYRDFFPDYISNVQPINFFGKKKFDYHFLNYLWDVANWPQKQRELDHLVSFTFELWSLVRKKDRWTKTNIAQLRLTSDPKPIAGNCIRLHLMINPSLFI